jgi:conjugal transfer/entry exclusion protein
MLKKQLTPEEINQIKELQTQYNKFVFDLGSIEAQLQTLYRTGEALETEKSNVITDINKLGEREKELVDSLQAKYGTGNINIETGEITPA